MLDINAQNETRLLALAALTQHSVNEVIEMLIENYQDDLDSTEAEQVLQETGGISLDDLKAKYAL